MDRSDLMYLPKDRHEEYIILRNNPSKTMEDLNRFPTYISIEPTPDCNAACRMCPLAHGDLDNLNLISDDLFEKIIDEIRPHSKTINQIQVQGRGEALLDKNIAHKVDVISNSLNIITTMSTNASLLTPAIAEELLDANLGSIVLAIDSLDKDVYEKIRKKLVFDVTLENAINFIELRNKKGASTQVRLRMVEQNPNSGEWEEYKKFWQPMLRPTDRLTLKKVHSFGNKLKIVDVRNIKTDLASFPCHGFWGTFNIMYDGLVQLCPGDAATLQYILGNVTNETIEEIWHGKKLNGFKNAHLNGKKVPYHKCDSCRMWSEPSDYENVGEKMFPELFEKHPEFKHPMELAMREEPSNVNLTPGENYV